MLETLISGTLWHVAKEISRSEPGKGGAVSLVQNTVCPQSIIRKLMVNRKVQTDPTLQMTLLKVVKDTQTDWDDHLPTVLLHIIQVYRIKAAKLTPLNQLIREYVGCRKTLIISSEVES